MNAFDVAVGLDGVTENDVKHINEKGILMVSFFSNYRDYIDLKNTQDQLEKLVEVSGSFGRLAENLEKL